MDSKEKLKLASLIAGIFSLIFLFFGLAMPAGALGVLFALLSRDTEKFEGRALTGFVLSLIGLIIGAVSTVSSLYLITSGTYEKMLDDLYEQTEEENEYVEQIREYLQQLNAQNGETGLVIPLPDTRPAEAVRCEVLYGDLSFQEVLL